jgi:hypothetical protein
VHGTFFPLYIEIENTSSPSSAFPFLRQIVLPPAGVECTFSPVCCLFVPVVNLLLYLYTPSLLLKYSFLSFWSNELDGGILIGTAVALIG